MLKIFEDRVRHFWRPTLLCIAIAFIIKMLGTAIERHGTDYVVWWVLAIMLVLALFYEFAIYCLCMYGIKTIAKKLDLTESVVFEGFFSCRITYKEALAMTRSQFLLRINIKRIARQAAEIAAKRMRENQGSAK